MVGVRHTMLGFATETDAEAWIAADRLIEGPLNGTSHINLVDTDSRKAAALRSSLSRSESPVPGHPYPDTSPPSGKLMSS